MAEMELVSGYPENATNLPVPIPILIPNLFHPSPKLKPQSGHLPQNYRPQNQALSETIKKIYR
jgi:hypothetical protein